MISNQYLAHLVESDHRPRQLLCSDQNSIRLDNKITWRLFVTDEVRAVTVLVTRDEAAAVVVSRNPRHISWYLPSAAEQSLWHSCRNDSSSEGQSLWRCPKKRLISGRTFSLCLQKRFFYFYDCCKVPTLLDMNLVHELSVHYKQDNDSLKKE